MGRRGGAKGGGRGGSHEAQDHYPPGYNGLGGGGPGAGPPGGPPGRMPFGGPPPPTMMRPEDMMGNRPRIWPLTPLGVTEVPPPIPPLPPCVLMPSSASTGPAPAEPTPDSDGVFGGAPPPILPPLPECILNPGAAFPPAAAPAPQAPGSPGEGGEDDREAANPDRKEEEYVIDHRTDRRTFFHTEGKGHTFTHTYTKPNGTQDVWQLGDRVRLAVEEVHFGNPRVGVMKGEPAPMPTMLKWSKDEFEKHVLDCAQVSFGSYWVWSAIGIRSNRILYAAKRLNVEEFNAVVVPPPHQAVQDEDIDLTYGASIQGIQLVPV